MTLDIAIDADAEGDSRSDWADLARSAAAAAIAESAFPQLGQGDRMVELSVRLTSDDEVHALNAEWRGKDKPTNVLSFPMAAEDELELSDDPGPELMLGDIILARGVCAAEAADKGPPLDSHAPHPMGPGPLTLMRR